MQRLFEVSRLALDELRKNIFAKLHEWMEVTKKRGLGGDDRLYREGVELSMGD